MVKAVAERLKNGGIESPEFEAECILEAVLGRSYKLELLMGRLTVTPLQQAEIEEMTYRRIKGEPLQYILGVWEFYGYEFSVGEGVLIPRQHTEVLVEAAIGHLEAVESPKGVDLCSGSGCVAIAVAKETGAELDCIEKYPEAYGYLAKNCKAHGVCNPVMGDVLDGSLTENYRNLDIITANPPYLTAGDMATLQPEVEFEPATALFGGEDGLDFYRVISRIWKPCLKVGGMIAFEIGLGQENDVKEMLEGLGYSEICYVNDLTERVRVVTAKVQNSGQL